MLAVALLRDNQGKIAINLPVTGSLSDPQFSVSSLIFKVFMNVLTKAVTSRLLCWDPCSVAAKNCLSSVLTQDRR
jgi:hypothetical protein